MKRGFGRRVLRGTAVVLIALTALSASMYLYSRLRGPSKAEREALALLQQTQNFEGRNAFAALWLLPYDVPAAQVEAVAAEDARRFAASPDPYTQAAGAAKIEPFVSIAAGKFAEDKVSTDNPCRDSSKPCLATVRASLDETRRAVARHTKLIARVRNLGQFRHYANAFAPRVGAPMPALQMTDWAVAADAVAFLDGDIDPALAGTCGRIATWRSLVHESDALFLSMMAISQVAQSSRLLADMLAELPLEHSLPSSCAIALAAPAARAANICAAMRGEFRQQTAFTRTINQARGDTGWEGNLNKVFYSEELSIRALTPIHAWICSRAAREAIERDERLSQPIRNRWQFRLEQFSNPVGAILVSIAGPAYSEYYRRAQDHHARLQLLATLIWLREQSPVGSNTTDSDAPRPTLAELQRQIDARPAALRSPTRPVTVTEDGTALQIKTYHCPNGKYIELPLPKGLTARPKAAAPSTLAANANACTSAAAARA